MAPGHKRSIRAQQPAARSAFGTHFKSPLKQRDTRKKRAIYGLGHVQRAEASRQRLEALLRREPVPSAQDATTTVPVDDIPNSDMEMADWIDVEHPSDPSFDPPPPPRPRERTGSAAQRLNDAWNLLLPALQTPWLRFYEHTHGQQHDIIPATLRHECTASCEANVVSEVKCLYPTHIQHVTVSTCCCKPVPVLLVEHGVFPASPTKTKTGVSLDLLDLYRALFERSCDAITALAAALHTVYERRGFKVSVEAVQWTSNLRDRVEKEVATMLARAESEPPGDASDLSSATPSTPSAIPSVTPSTAPSATPSVTSHDPEIPAWGVPPPDAPPPAPSSGPPPLKPGGVDVQFGGDGCFSYRHLRKAGDGPISYDPTFFIPQHKVEAVAEKIKAARKCPSAKVKPLMPQEVIDACNESWDAANEKKRKADPKRYDASGVFVMTCRHGQVLFLCNVTTPGEQQCLIVSMLEEVFSMLPENATVLQAYDVGCVTDHSLNLPEIPPRSRPWGSRDRRTILVAYTQAYTSDKRSMANKFQNSRRIWMIDQYAAFVSKEGRAGLGNWINRQQRKSVTPKHRAAMRTLQDCRVPMPLLAYWRELDKVLSLQNQIDGVEKAIDETKKTLRGSQASPHSLHVLHGLELTHERLGRREALGTKLHQSTRKAISRWQPSLLKAIKKFNAGCETLEQLCPPQCNIPLPSPLSTQLNGLRNDPSLHEDVWITPSEGPIPLWLNDEDVRDGIRSLHLADRCAEEVMPLNVERDNLRRWLLEEQQVVSRAIGMMPDSPLTFLLRWRQEEVADLQCSWAPFLRLQDIDSHFLKESTTSAMTLGTFETPFGAPSVTSVTSVVPSATSAATSITPAHIPTILPSSTPPILHSARPSPVVGAGLGRVSVVTEVDNFFDDSFDEAEEAAGEGEIEHELDAGAISDEDQANLIEEVLHESDQEDETETSTASNYIDTSLISQLQTHNSSLIITSGNFPHFVVRTRTGLGPLRISVDDWKPFRHPTGRLTGLGLNGVAASLHILYSDPYFPTMTNSATRCAVFSTYDLPMCSLQKF
ncbi:hypothetical protein DFH07DRAFT_770370 [Mycena maculata]|uniref:CxC1-like cysteine cluster associated with KDZ transposases domain-containing protein n=1 Tax=Mycena maculata TaxID=230809 RepID=A0AAD7JHE3_9AGAR|nr:hypothetical protein DFH07DRAFT_770370 [Mycena maculata]